MTIEADIHNGVPPPRARSAAAGGGTACATLVLATGNEPAPALFVGVGFAIAGAVASVLRRGSIEIT